LGVEHVLLLKPGLPGDAELSIRDFVGGMGVGIDPLKIPGRIETDVRYPIQSDFRRTIRL
jgi:hypothetical protein